MEASYGKDEGRPALSGSLIGHGDSVIIRMKWFERVGPFIQTGWNRDDVMDIVPSCMEYAGRGFFVALHAGNAEKTKRKGDQR